MAFNLITTTAGTYTLDIPGNYQKTGTAFGAPEDHFRISGGTRVRSDIRASVVRRLTADVQVQGAPVGTLKRVAAAASLQLTIPANGGFTSAQIATLVDELRQFLTAANVERLLKGES